jgi:endonuclease/exonuclease/phosphatase (EEP) superfamily protein YafD
LVLRAAHPGRGRPLPGRSLALVLLGAADLGLVVVVAGGLGALVDAVAPLTGHLLGIGTAAGIALLVRRRMVALLTVGVAATIAVHAWLGLARCCAPGVPAAAALLTRAAAYDSGESLTVLALDTWAGRADPGRLERYLATAPADVVVLSQLAPALRPMLDRLRQAYPYQVACAERPSCALALLSRSPFAAAGSARIAPGKPAFVWARLPGALTIIGTRLHHPMRDPWLHQAQVEALAQFARRIGGSLVVAGDLNTSPWSNAFRLLRSDAGLSPAGPLTPSWPAWPVSLPQIAADHIFVSSDLGVAAAGTGPAVGSDHLPVWAHLERRAVPAHMHRRPANRLASRLAAPGPHLGGEFLADLGGEEGGAGNLRR